MCKYVFLWVWAGPGGRTILASPQWWCGLLGSALRCPGIVCGKINDIFSERCDLVRSRLEAGGNAQDLSFVLSAAPPPALIVLNV